MTANIKDVAALAGVSRTTVSHALNGKGRVSPETLARIQDAARQLAYTPLPQAVQLRTQEHHIIGIQFGSVEENSLIPRSTFYHALVNSAASAASAQGWPLVVVPPRLDGSALRKLSLDYGVCVDFVGDEAFLQSLSKQPGVIVSNFPHEVLKRRHPDSCVAILDWENPTWGVLDHLEKSGYHHVAIVGSHDPLPYEREIFESVQSWKPAGRTKTSVVRVDERKRTQTLRQLITGKGGVDALWFLTDIDVFHVLTLARQLGVLIPGDLGLVVGVDVPAYAYVAPSITAIDMSPEIYGARAVALLLQLQSEGQGRWVVAPRIPTRLVARRSTDRHGVLTEAADT